ncbi:MAG: cation transporter [Deltaproteobacteria bacterium]|nr:cation transporter [Deltaproteobacteria bacterium]
MINSVVKRKLNVAKLSVGSNLLLVVLKVIVGLVIGSVSVLSEAIHSGVDLLAAIIAWFAVRTSSRPADDNHPFGHGKVENISGTIEALLIFLAAGWIIFEAVHKLLKPEPMNEAFWGIMVMLFSSITNLLVSQRLFQVGRQTDSVALQADAWHLRTDVYTSAGVMFGLAVIWLGKWRWPEVDLNWIDPAAAIAVALLIIKAAWDLTVQSARDLLDVGLPHDEITLIREHILSQVPMVRSIHRFRTRKSGASRFVEFHMLVDPAMSVDESHRVTDVITLSIREHYPETSVTIHIEPCNGQCEPKCVGNCLLSDQDRQEVRANGPKSN